MRAPRVTLGGVTGTDRTGLLRLGSWGRVANGDAADAMLGSLVDAGSARTAPWSPEPVDGRLLADLTAEAP